MRGKPLLPWSRSCPDDRETIRLALVAVACEVAVLTALMDGDLLPVRTDPRAGDLQHRCCEQRRVALELLSHDTRFEDFSPEGLLDTLDAFQGRLEEVLSLRLHVEQLLLAGSEDALCIALG